MFETRLEIDRLIRHTAIATVTTDSLARAFLTWFEHPDFDPDLPVLWDVRRQFVEISFDELDTLHQLTIDRTTRRRTRDSRSAILVSEMIMEMAAGEIVRNPRFNATYRIFMSERPALEWLGVERGTGSVGAADRAALVEP